MKLLNSSGLIKAGIWVLFSLCVIIPAHSQIRALLQGSDSSRSFYHIAKISENEYWAGGERGILYRVDASGNIEPISHPGGTLSFLHIERIGNKVILATDNQAILLFDLELKSWKKVMVPGMRNRAFYSLTELPSGQLALCGGHHKTAHGHKRVPKGFVMQCDTGIHSARIIWKNRLRFPWSVTADSNNNLFIAAFNGINTKLFIHKSGTEGFNRFYKTRNLIHEIQWIDQTMYACGAEGYRKKDKGIIEHLNPGGEISFYHGTLWSLKVYEGLEFAASCSGGHLRVFKPSGMPLNEWKDIKLPTDLDLYDLAWISRKRLLTAGHGMGLYLVDLE